jgi:hypothetical protein
VFPVSYTNILTYSQGFDNTEGSGVGWLRFNIAVTGGSINAEFAPDGNQTADRALETGSGSLNHYIAKDLLSAGTSTQIRTHSVYVKGGLGRQYAIVSCGNSSSNNYYAITIDLSTGSITQVDLADTGTAWFTTTPTVTVTPVSGTGLLWYRVAITCRQVQYFLVSPSDTALPASGGNFGLGLYNSDVTKGVIVWGGQVETGTTANPYVATAATPVTTTLAGVTTNVWIPTVLADLTLTQSTGTKDTITGGTYVFSNIVQIALSPDVSLYRPATVDNTKIETASVLVDTVGSQLVQLQFKASGGSMGAAWYSI